MALKKKIITAYMADGSEHTVTLTLADQLRGELEARKNGILLDLPMHMGTVWVWCALTRLHLYEDPFQQFLNVDCLDWDDGTGDEEDVDPTQPAAPAGSSSPSPSPSPEPPLSSGSPQTTS